MAKFNFCIPYRNRKKQLEIIMDRLPNFLEMQDINYEIIIVEQEEKKRFNFGKLLNVGFTIYKIKNIFLNTYNPNDVFVFFPVDLIPTKIDFDMKQFEVEILLHKNENFYGKSFLFKNYAYERFNGFHNDMWGWGGDDDEMFKRLELHKINFRRKKFDAYDIFEEIYNHRDVEDHQERKDLIKNLKNPQDVFYSGLSNLNYSINEFKIINNLDFYNVKI